MSLPSADEVKEIEVRREEGNEQEQSGSSSKSVESSKTKSAKEAKLESKKTFDFCENNVFGC